MGACAGKGAIIVTVADGGTKIIDIAISVSKLFQPYIPFEACRHQIFEFSNCDTNIIIGIENKKLISIKIKDLLPKAFSSRHLA